MLVVLYKRNFLSSETLRTLGELKKFHKDIHLVIWDNSPVSNLDYPEWCSNLAKVDTKITNFNESFSKIYNTIIEEYSSQAEFFLLFDHDTNLHSDFFLKLALNTQTFSDYYLFLPKIVANGNIVSPAKQFWIKGSYFKNLDPGVYSSKRRSAINSGMIIRFNYFSKFNFRYDKRLTFYGTDNFFMIHFAQNKCKFVVLDTILNHSLSFFDKSENINDRINRFKQMRKSNFIIFRRNIFETVGTLFYLILQSMFYSIKFRNTKILKW